MAFDRLWPSGRLIVNHVCTKYYMCIAVKWLQSTESRTMTQNSFDYCTTFVRTCFHIHIICCHIRMLNDYVYATKFSVLFVFSSHAFRPTRIALDALHKNSKGLLTLRWLKVLTHQCWTFITHTYSCDYYMQQYMMHCAPHMCVI